jgi:hypothetical protein
MMDVVILNKKESFDTIRYCVRSIHKYVDYRNIWVVGYKPDYLNVNHIHVEDNHFIPQVNGTRKLHEASKHPDIGDFILFHDDMFLNDTYEPKMYCNGRLMSKYRKCSGIRANCMRITMKHTSDRAYNYELHYPMPFIKDKIRSILDAIEYEKGIVYYSLYGNLSDSFESYQIKDCKTYKPTKDMAFFSTHPRMEREENRQMFESFYPKPTIYEQDQS